MNFCIHKTLLVKIKDLEKTTPFALCNFIYTFFFQIIYYTRVKNLRKNFFRVYVWNERFADCVHRPWYDFKDIRVPIKILNVRRKLKPLVNFLTNEISEKCFLVPDRFPLQMRSTKGKVSEAERKLRNSPEAALRMKVPKEKSKAIRESCSDSHD